MLALPRARHGFSQRDVDSVRTDLPALQRHRMKLVIQIPAWDEEGQIAAAVR